MSPGVCLLSVFVATWMPSVFGINITVFPHSPRVNQTVLLNIWVTPENVQHYDWYKGDTTNATQQIIRIDSTGFIIKGQSFFRESTVLLNGSLQITNANKTHEGFYTVSVQQANQLKQGKVYLTLEEPSGGLSNGAIAGIIIAVIVVVVVIAVSLFVYVKKGSSAANVREDVL
ncbi:cell adhesion molecule CEACAM1-like [Rhinoderma darwinii]|uniref:cell adhesion molecule CEACAM1-like n=1 Tax=Rhinoderma darwinii TaxID=43563 RepID=UPI003F67AB78